jgi:quercetin dioxygenase-like cupin family protein
MFGGVLTVQLGKEAAFGGPGAWAFAPPDTLHTLANLTEQPVKLLCVFAPAGLERRSEHMLAQQAGQPPPERSAVERETA